MHINTFFEVLSASHVTYKLSGVPQEFSQRSGIVLIAPPGHLKSEIIKGALGEYHNAIVLSDLNSRTLNVMRDDIVSGKIQTLAFPDFEKLYERDPSTSSHLEGHLKAIVAQGFTLPSLDDQRINGVREARALLVAGLIPKVHRQKFTRWKDEGMTRRFIWCHYQLSDPDAILNAIKRWEPLKFDVVLMGIPPGQIPFSISKDEDHHIQKMMSQHEGGCEALPFILMKKIGSVLKWRYRRNGDKKASLQMLSILADFAECLTKRGAQVEI